MRDDAHHAGLATATDAVFDRVLDERLEHEGRNGDRVQRLRNGDLRAEPVGEAQPLDLQIPVDERQFLAQRHFVRLISQRRPQQLAEL